MPVDQLIVKRGYVNSYEVLYPALLASAYCIVLPASGPTPPAPLIRDQRACMHAAVSGISSFWLDSIQNYSSFHFDSAFSILSVTEVTTP